MLTGNTITSILRTLKHSSNPKGFVFVDKNRVETTFSFAEIAQATERRGRLFLRAGLTPGDRAAIIMRDNQDFVLSFLGCIAVNIIPVPIYPPPLMGKKERYLQTAADVVKNCRAHCVITTDDEEKLIREFDPQYDKFKKTLSISALSNLTPDDRILELPLPQDTCFIQFTSGSTSDPKGVVVSHRNLIANTRAIVNDGLKAKPECDRGISWLPLYHDMGLIGFVIAPIVGSIPVVLLPTLSFVRRPALWMQAIDKYRGTISFGPNFAFALATKRAPRVVNAGIDLSCLRVLGCGAEPISPKIIREFSAAFEPAGFNPKAITASYGMAEASLAISFEALNHGLSTLTIDDEIYQKEHRVKVLEVASSKGREVVACGHIIKDHTVTIESDKGQVLDDKQVGEVVVEGPSITSGYFENPTATAKTYRNHRLHTQDFGFLHNGRLYICGRQKDLIILNGRNYHPQSLEWAIEQHECLRQGSVVCFSVSGDKTEGLVVTAETGRPQNTTLKSEIRSTISREFGLKVHDVILLKSGQLPKTSSGKRQRNLTLALYLTNQLQT